MERHEEFKSLLNSSSLSQAEFGRFIGHSSVAVNRWIRQRATDATTVPEYALAFARAYARLSFTDRRELQKIRDQSGLVCASTKSSA